MIVPSWGRSLIFDRSSDNCKAVEVSSVEAFMPVYTYESFATVGEIRVYWRADFKSGSRVLKKVL